MGPLPASGKKGLSFPIRENATHLNEPELRELELNPVTVMERGRGAVALDARVRIGEFEAAHRDAALGASSGRFSEASGSGLLDRFDVIDERADSCLSTGWAERAVLRENPSPDRHLALTVRAERSGTFDEPLDPFSRELALMGLRDQRQVRRRGLERIGGRTVSTSALSVARRAVILKQLLTPSDTRFLLGTDLVEIFTRRIPARENGNNQVR
jgi:hypothetical protein